MNLVINVMNLDNGDKIIININGKRIVKDYEETLHNYLTGQEELFKLAETIDEAKDIIDEVLKTLVEEPIKIVRINEYLVHNKQDNNFYLALKDNISTWPMPEVFAQRIIKTSEKNLNVKPLVKSWIRLLRNPCLDNVFINRFCDYVNSKYLDLAQYNELIEQGINVETAKLLATCYDVAITSAGLLATNKYARIVYNKFDKETGEIVPRYEESYDEETGIKITKLPDNIEDYTLEPPVQGQSGDAFFCGDGIGHQISVGKIHRLPNWSFVDLNHDQMYKGLWLGGLSYIQGYGGKTKVLLQCFVDPAKIGSFYKGGEFSAIKVLEYFVHSAVDIPNKALYHESTYAEQTELDWEQDVTKAIETINKLKAKLDADAAEINALDINI